MSTKTVKLNGQHVSYDDLIAYVRKQQKIRSIKLIKTAMKLDLRDAKDAVELIQKGEYDRAFQILNPHAECSDPILDNANGLDYSKAGHRNPFLIEESKGRNVIMIAIVLAIALLILGGIFSYLSMRMSA